MISCKTNLVCSKQTLSLQTDRVKLSTARLQDENIKAWKKPCNLLWESDTLFHADLFKNDPKVKPRNIYIYIWRRGKSCCCSGPPHLLQWLGTATQSLDVENICSLASLGARECKKCMFDNMKTWKKPIVLWFGVEPLCIINHICWHTHKVSSCIGSIWTYQVRTNECQ